MAVLSGGHLRSLSVITRTMVNVCRVRRGPTRTPSPTCLSSVLVLRDIARGSWLAGGFQRAVEKSFTVTLLLYLAFVFYGLHFSQWSSYASFCPTTSLAWLVVTGQRCGSR